MMASAPVALSAKVAAWANIVFMDQPSLFSLRRHAMRRFMLLFAGSVPTAARRGKAGKFPAQSGSKAIFLANRREILPMIGNGARDAVHRPIGGLSGRGRTREPGGEIGSGSGGEGACQSV